MELKNKHLIIITILLASLQAGLFYFLFKQAEVPITESVVSTFGINAVKSSVRPTAVHQAYFNDKGFYEEAYAGISNDNNPNKDYVYGGILPHHLFVKEKIAAFLDGLSTNDYETIILIGPNHFSQGNKIITSQALWQTPYGDLLPNQELIEVLGLEVDEAPFVNEHSISGLVGFIKKSLPNAKIVPIILRSDVSIKEVDAMSQKIFTSVDPEKTLVLASVDFSHYQPVSVADLHDQASRAAIENFDYKRIENLEIDSPASIRTVLKYLELTGASSAELCYATNSGRLQPISTENTTSHNFFYFRQGEEGKDKFFSGLFFGDLMLDRYLRERIKKVGVSGIFDSIAGEEKRFLSGTDLVTANLEGATTNKGEHYSPQLANDFAFEPKVISELKKYNFNFFNLANNHLSDQGQQGIIETRKNLTDLGFEYSGCVDGQLGDCSVEMVERSGVKIAMIGLSEVYQKVDLAEAVALIKRTGQVADFVVVNLHWGSEYTHQASQHQQDLAHALVVAGADVIIGHHPHVVQGVEVYQGKPIFYSLGNFVFDQYFSQDTQEGLAVGLFLVDKKTTAYLFPLREVMSVPELLRKEARVNFLSKVSEWSFGNAEFKKQVKAGVLELVE